MNIGVLLIDIEGKEKSTNFDFQLCSIIAVNLLLELITKIINITGVTVQKMAAQVNFPVANAWAP